MGSIHRHYSIRLGTRVHLRFWDDDWCQAGILKDRFPRLFAATTDKDVLMTDCISSGTWVPPLPISIAEGTFDDLLSLLQVLQTTSPGTGLDGWVWKHGSLGSLCFSSLHSAHPSTDLSEVETWKGKISRQVAQPQKRNVFLERLYDEGKEPHNEKCSQTDENQNVVQDEDVVQSLENDVYYWTDFSKVQYHPRSLFELCTSWIDIEEFKNYGSGNGVLSAGLQGEELNDRLRYFVEECDGIQGFQFTVDDSGVFSSVAVDFLQSIADDYSKTPLLLYTARSPDSFTSTDNQRLSVDRALHDAVSFSQLSNYCHLIVPLGLSSFNTGKVSDFLCIDDMKLFHSSAVYAASINSISLPFRMELLGSTANSKNVFGPMDIGELVHMLSGQGWGNMVAILDASVPAPSLDGSSSHECYFKSFHPLNQEVVKDEVEDSLAVESMVIQGAFQSGMRASVTEMGDFIYEANRSRTPSPRFFHLSAALSPLPIPLCFPSIFRDSVGKQGELLSNSVQSHQPRGPLEVESIPIGARLRSCRAILPFIEKRLSDLQRFAIRRGAPGMQLLRSWGFSNTEAEEMGEMLFKMARTLDPQPEVSSDSD